MCYRLAKTHIHSGRIANPPEPHSVLITKLRNKVFSRDIKRLAECELQSILKTNTIKWESITIETRLNNQHKVTNESNY